MPIVDSRNRRVYPRWADRRFVEYIFASAFRACSYECEPEDQWRAACKVYGEFLVNRSMDRELFVFSSMEVSRDT